MMKVKTTLLLMSVMLIVFSCNKEDDDDNNAGSINSIYYQEFNVDTTNYSNDTTFYDINNDGTFDIEVARIIEIGNTEARYSGQFRSLDEPIDFCFMINSPSLSMIEYGDEINGKERVFEWIPEVNYSGSIGVSNDSYYWPQGVFTKYFGFKLSSAQGPHFGWFRFKHFELAEMAVNLDMNEPIWVGQKE
ncbi:MAG: hypothetical protein ACI9DK_001484 [Vicingaceae bacterium]|jgi:hypothetical protein